MGAPPEAAASLEVPGQSGHGQSKFLVHTPSENIVPAGLRPPNRTTRVYDLDLQLQCTTPGPGAVWFRASGEAGHGTRTEVKPARAAGAGGLERTRTRMAGVY